MKTNEPEVSQYRMPSWVAPFATEPGSALKSRQGILELVNLVSAPRGCSTIVVFLFLLLPLGGFAYPIIPCVVGVLGLSVTAIFAASRSGRCLSALPIPAAQLSWTLWFIVVVYFPLIYGIAQTPVRLLIALGFGTEASRFTYIVPDCILAMGVGAVLYFTGPIVIRPFTEERAGHWFILGAPAIGALFGVLIVLLMDPIARIHEKAHSAAIPSYAILVVAAGVFTVLSGIQAARSSAGEWLASRKQQDLPTETVRWGSRRASQTPASFWTMWIVRLQFPALYAILLGVILPIAMIRPWENGFDDAWIVYGVIAPVLLIMFSLDSSGIELLLPGPRAVRSLPLRRWQQTALILSFVVPETLPGVVVLVGYTLLFSLSPSLVCTFLIALTATLAMRISFTATLQSTGSSRASLLIVPVVLPFISGNTTWLPILYVAWGIACWRIAFQNLHQSLLRGGSVYSTLHESAQRMAGRC